MNISNISKERIEKLFAESIYEKFKTVRYGIKSCRDLHDPECLFRIKELYYHTESKFDCDQDSTDCSFKKIKELINTL